MISKPQQYRGKVSEHILINKKFQYLHIELIEPYRIEFEAGQYLSLQVSGEKRRSYSIASAPMMNHAVEICVDVSPGGIGSEYLKNLTPGDEVFFMAPLGRFVLQQAQDEGVEKKLLLVGTGSGIAPLRSMVLDLLEQKEDKRQIKLYWGLRFVDDMFWQEDFRRLSRYYANFEFYLSLSKPPEKWPMSCGHVTEQIKNEEQLGPDWGVYLCGNQAMINEVSQMVQEMGVPRKQVHFEKFF